MFDEYNYNSIFGYQVIAIPYMADRVQARTHKKKRINKKWRKRYGFREVPWKQFYIDTANMRIYCHPKIVEKIKAEIYMR